jgi:hypothetical protein
VLADIRSADPTRAARRPATARRRRDVSKPPVSGTPVVGDSFKASPGQWQSNNPITLSYGWLRCPDTNVSHCVGVQSSDSPTYRIQPGDDGDRMKLTVIASGVGGATQVFAPAFTGVVDTLATVDERASAAHAAAHQAPPSIPVGKLTGGGGTAINFTPTLQRS